MYILSSMELSKLIVEKCRLCFIESVHEQHWDVNSSSVPLALTWAVFNFPKFYNKTKDQVDNPWDFDNYEKCINTTIVIFYYDTVPKWSLVSIL